MPVKNKSKQAHNQFLKDRLGKINEVIAKLEGEVEKALGHLKKRSEKSSKLIKKNFDEIVGKISSTELSKEVKKVADEILANIKKVDLDAARGLINEVRGSVDELVQKFQSYGLLEKAVDAAQNTRRQVFKLFSIPSKDEVDELNRKVNSLERKIKTLSHKKEEVAAA
ncbi:MAG: hypothetical protein A3G32_05485 [Deltaproteobacteria bacterium RIFCSPLOWO2_12_FULL_40_28]|nr:MAG: hypothetical protein A3C45_03655 [Deltaproteobacteria bacterium RIFCSPHIGHO2_02_FULL_40_28]OGQ18921.1 MAG: hypothetical protein A3E27_09485 [Deltaproteobacteria bacterium RIFCSPHIGHO2_12_FULL_40_32]OGQ39464.1 MAG: hypothetical protein A3I69_09600 [Deltaproteobacteria bacterium RIFCSPLOWO2_02_FULL_40_36]OGQ53354.1 MAG: hypothetical protein A3G32_05485 [Deltaproteobacteria bacterium RIFCSPLOWO2_12_FULL_40_28]